MRTTGLIHPITETTRSRYLHRLPRKNLGVRPTCASKSGKAIAGRPIDCREQQALLAQTGDPALSWVFQESAKCKVQSAESDIVISLYWRFEWPNSSSGM